MGQAFPRLLASLALLLSVSTAHAARWQKIRAKVAQGALLGLISGVTKVANRMPFARASRYQVRVEKNVRYGRDPRNLIDVYHPDPALGPGPHPIVIYVHGGGFTALSKDTHHTLALDFAKQGYTVYNVDYRLAPEHAFPAAHEDVFKAYEWIVKQAAKRGGDVSKIVLAGESAGANIIASIVNATTRKMDDPAAQRLFQLGVVPKVVLPACGHLQVEDAARYDHMAEAGWYARDRVKSIEDAVYGKSTRAQGDRELAEPLKFLEQQVKAGTKPLRTMPKFFLFAGDKDPLVGDTHRYFNALREQGADAEMKIYKGKGHAFHLMPWKPATKDAKSLMFEFAARALQD